MQNHAVHKALRVISSIRHFCWCLISISIVLASTQQCLFFLKKMWNSVAELRVCVLWWRVLSSRSHSFDLVYPFPGVWFFDLILAIPIFVFSFKMLVSLPICGLRLSKIPSSHGRIWVFFKFYCYVFKP